nr:hypothetical protein L203_03483 [Cryptococcus depauperatus CBS 7841]
MSFVPSMTVTGQQVCRIGWTHAIDLSPGPPSQEASIAAIKSLFKTFSRFLTT